MNNEKRVQLNTALLLIVIAMLGVVIWLLVSCGCVKNNQPVIDNLPKGNTEVVEKTPTVPKTPAKQSPITSVTVNQQFTLNLNQYVFISGTNYTVTLNGFYYHPCPEGAQCIWSGLDVFYTIENIKTGEVFVKDQPMEALADAPYVVNIKETDYKTYATLSIEPNSAISVTAQ